MEHISRESLSYQADSFAVGDNTLALISRSREAVEPGDEPSSDLAVGDVLRRTCKLAQILGDINCKAVCQQPEGYDSPYDRLCSDQNLSRFLTKVNVQPNDVLLIGVTADGVGFYDQMDEYSDELHENSVGVRELPGFNAFFARASEQVVLGARLADCGYAAIEFEDAVGQQVIGFTHLTRPNLQGESKLAFERDGKPAGSFEYFLHQALEHYGGTIESVQVRLIAAIKAENFIHTFTDEPGKTMEDLFPGWSDMGLMRALPDGSYAPRYREMLAWQIARSGLRPEQVVTGGMIDPADLELGHASNHAGAHGKMPDARDAYLIMPRDYQHLS